jgi:hypothetical protein
MVQMTYGANTITTPVIGSASIGTKPTTILEVSEMKFMIMDAPRPSNLHLYIREMQNHENHGVHGVAPACDPTYHPGELENAGLVFHEMGYQDGTSPSPELIENWL